MLLRELLSADGDGIGSRSLGIYQSAAHTLPAKSQALFLKLVDCKCSTFPPVGFMLILQRATYNLYTNVTMSAQDRSFSNSHSP
jgi:hypothetical protein